MVIWLIGISGAGKTTIGKALCERLRGRGRPCLLLDGDQMRVVWGDVNSHDLAARRSNHERISKLCALLAREPGVDLVVPALSIFPDLRAWNRSHISGYVEVFLDISVEMASRRDSKGIYGRAARGELRNVAGVDLSFPPPEAPDLRIGGADLLQPPVEIVDRICSFLDARGSMVNANV